MPVQPFIPPDWTWVYDLVVGQGWPQANEDSLRNCAKAWTDAHGQLASIAQDGDVAAQNVGSSVQSMSSDQFTEYWKQYIVAVKQLSDQSDGLAKQLAQFADQTEFTKLSIDIQIVILVIQLIIDAAIAIITAGGSTAEGIAAAFLTRLTIRGMLEQLLRAVLAAVLPDVITQTIMLAQGHRHSYDLGETLQAAQMGVIGGAIGIGLGALGNKIGLTKALTSRFGGVAGGLINAGIHGAVTADLTNAATGLADAGEQALFDPGAQQTYGMAQEKSSQNPFLAALNGAFTGMLFHGVHETGTALGGGNHFEPTPFTLDNGQSFNAVQIRDGTGSNYALFDDNMKLVGTGTLDQSGGLSVTPNGGDPFSAQVTNLPPQHAPGSDQPLALGGGNGNDTTTPPGPSDDPTHLAGADQQTANPIAPELQPQAQPAVPAATPGPEPGSTGNPPESAQPEITFQPESRPPEVPVPAQVPVTPAQDLPATGLVNPPAPSPELMPHGLTGDTPATLPPTPDTQPEHVAASQSALVGLTGAEPGSGNQEPGTLAVGESPVVPGATQLAGYGIAAQPPDVAEPQGPRVWSPGDAERDLTGRQPRIPPDQFAEPDRGGTESYVVTYDDSRSVYKPETGVYRTTGRTEWIGKDLYSEAWQGSDLWTQVPADEVRYVRELAAYSTDQMLGFDLVPTTAQASFDTAGAYGPGSVQEFVPGSEPRSPEMYSVPDQQRMAVLDYVMANSDRHGDNYLTGTDGRPVAIDNGETFPPTSENGIVSRFVHDWQGEPLSPEVLDQVRAVDLGQFRDMLLVRGISEQAADGAVARLAEIQVAGVISGKAFGGEIYDFGQRGSSALAAEAHSGGLGSGGGQPVANGEPIAADQQTVVQGEAAQRPSPSIVDALKVELVHDGEPASGLEHGSGFGPEHGPGSGHAAAGAVHGHADEPTTPTAHEPVRYAEVRSVVPEGNHLRVELSDGERTTFVRVDVDRAARRLIVSTYDENGEVLREMAGRVVAEPGMFDVFSHADQNGLLVDGMHMPFEKLADYLPELSNDAMIRLCGCQAGHGEAIAELARVTGRSVLAADSTVWIDKNGNVFAALEHDEGGQARPVINPDGTTDGVWRIFHPDGSQTEFDQPRLRHIPDSGSLQLGQAVRWRQIGFRGSTFRVRPEDLPVEARQFARGSDAVAVAGAPYDFNTADQAMAERGGLNKLNVALRNLSGDSFDDFRNTNADGKSYSAYQAERVAKAGSASQSRASADARIEAAMMESGKLKGTTDSMLVHGIKVDVSWTPSGEPVEAKVVSFPDSRESYNKIINDLKGYRDSYSGFDKDFARSILDLAKAGDTLPTSLKELAGKLFSDEEVSRKLLGPDGKFRSDANWDSEVGKFMKRAASLAVLHIELEGARNHESFVTNLMVWRMIADGHLSLDKGLGYLNLMGPAGAADIARRLAEPGKNKYAAAFFSGASEEFKQAYKDVNGQWEPKTSSRGAAERHGALLQAAFPDAFENGKPKPDAITIIATQELDRNIAEFQRREREILALYAMKETPNLLPAAGGNGAIGVSELNAFFFGADGQADPRKAVESLTTHLWLSLGW